MHGYILLNESLQRLFKSLDEYIPTKNIYINMLDPFKQSGTVDNDAKLQSF